MKFLNKSREFEVMDKINKRPDFMTFDQWQKYCSMFTINPVGANSYMNDLEIELHAEYCVSWPKNLIINLTSMCNMLCRFCGQVNFQKGYEKGYNLSHIDVDKLKAIFQDVERGYPLNVGLQGDGEPLIQKDFRDVYTFCKNKFPYSDLQVCTNGVGLTPGMSEFLYEGKLAWLNISLNAGSADIHEKVTGVRVFERIISNIAYFQKLKQSHNSARPGIGMSYVLARYNLDDVENFICLCADLGIKYAQINYMTAVSKEMLNDSVIHEKHKTNKVLELARLLAADLNINVGFPTTFENTVESDATDTPPILDFDSKTHRRDTISARNKALAEGKKEMRPGCKLKNPENRQLINKAAALRCTYPWDFISLKGNGGAQLCCGAIGFEDGNIFEEGFWNVWNGSVRRFLRRTVNSNNVDKICMVCPLNKVRDVDSLETHARPGC